MTQQELALDLWFPPHFLSSPVTCRLLITPNRRSKTRSKASRPCLNFRIPKRVSLSRLLISEMTSPSISSIDTPWFRAFCTTNAEVLTTIRRLESWTQKKTPQMNFLSYMNCLQTSLINRTSCSHLPASQDPHHLVQTPLWADHASMRVHYSKPSRPIVAESAPTDSSVS